MDLTVEEAAEGILKVVNATMVRGIRMVSVERGHDARKFALVCFGGAGPVHAVALAKQMNIQKLIVPEAPGVNCALGLLMADFRHDYSKTFLHNLWNLDSAALSKEYAQMEQGALMQLVEEHVHEMISYSIAPLTCAIRDRAMNWNCLYLISTSTPLRTCAQFVVITAILTRINMAMQWKMNLWRLSISV